MILALERLIVYSTGIALILAMLILTASLKKQIYADMVLLKVGTFMTFYK